MTDNVSYFISYHFSNTDTIHSFKVPPYRSDATHALDSIFENKKLLRLLDPKLLNIQCMLSFLLLAFISDLFSRPDATSYRQFHIILCLCWQTQVLGRASHQITLVCSIPRYQWHRGARQDKFQGMSPH